MHAGLGFKAVFGPFLGFNVKFLDTQAEATAAVEAHHAAQEAAQQLQQVASIASPTGNQFETAASIQRPSGPSALHMSPSIASAAGTEGVGPNMMSPGAGAGPSAYGALASSQRASGAALGARLQHQYPQQPGLPAPPPIATSGVAASGGGILASVGSVGLTEVASPGGRNWTRVPSAITQSTSVRSDLSGAMPGGAGSTTTGTSLVPLSAAAAAAQAARQQQGQGAAGGVDDGAGPSRPGPIAEATEQDAAGGPMGHVQLEVEISPRQQQQRQQDGEEIEASASDRPSVAASRRRGGGSARQPIEAVASIGRSQGGDVGHHGGGPPPSKEQIAKVLATTMMFER